MEKILKKAIKDYYGKRPKITFIGEDYQVKREKGIVRCCLRCKMPNTLFSDREFRIFIGTAQVCGKDTFNEEVGKKIARSKAELKAYNTYARQFEKLFQSIKDYIVIIGKEMKKADENYLNSMDYLDNYCKEEE